MSEWTKVPKTQARKTKTKNITSTSTPIKPKDVKSNVNVANPKARKPLRDKNSQINIKATSPKTVDKKKLISPKTIDDCNNCIGDATKLQDQINELKRRSPDRPNAWLNDLVQYLVSLCNLQEKNCPKDQYLKKEWIKLVPKVEKVLVNAMKDDSEYYVNAHVRSNLFHETLLNMIEESCKNRPIAGYKIIIQILSKHFASECIKSTTDRVFFHASQAFAYRSNPSTSMPLIWSLGLPFIYQASLTGNLSIEIFEKVMIPITDHKPVNRCVVYYFNKIIEQYQNTPSKIQLFSPKSTILLMQDAFTANLEKSDSITMRENVDKIPLSVGNFEEYMSILASDKANGEFLSFVLMRIKKLLSVQSSATEISKIWVNIYENHVKESSILLKYLIENFESLETVSKKVLAIICKRIVKKNERLICQAQNKKQINKIQIYCDALIDASTFPYTYKKLSNLKSSNVESMTSKNIKNMAQNINKVETRRKFSFCSLLFNTFYYAAVLSFFTVLSIDLYTANGSWSEMQARQTLIKTHPVVANNLPKVENFVDNEINSRVKHAASYGYGKVYKLSPDKFDAFESALQENGNKVKEFIDHVILPKISLAFEKIDTRVTKIYIDFKASKFDVTIMKTINNMKKSITNASADIPGALTSIKSNIIKQFTNLSALITKYINIIQTDVTKNGPKYLEQLKSDIRKYSYQLQLAIGKFMLNLKPILIRYYKYLVEILSIIYKDFFIPGWEKLSAKDGILSQTFEKTIKITAPFTAIFQTYWNLLVDEFWKVFTIIQGKIDAL